MSAIRHRPLVHRRPAGFTLLELLITIAIIAMLAGMVTPMVMLVIDRAVDTSCVTNLRSVTTGLKGYTAENFSFPYIRHTTQRGGDMTGEYASYWKDYIVFNNDAAVFGWTNLGLLWSPKADGNPDVPEGKYIKNEDHFWCPKFYRKNESFDLGWGGCPWPPAQGPWGGWAKTKATYSRRPACGGKFPGKIPDGAAVVADYFPRIWSYSQLPEHVHRNGEGFHVGYYSGKVEWFDDPDGIAVDYAGFRGSTNRDSATRTERSWQKLDETDVPWTPEAYLD